MIYRHNQIFFCLLFIFLYFQLLFAQVIFKDVSDQVGFVRHRGRRLKYGGAAVADLDGDGWPDLICGHHDEKFIDLYFNRRDGTFARNPWKLWIDAHGFSPFRFSPYDKRMHFALSPGGAFGSKPTTPLVWKVNPGRVLKEVTYPIGVGSIRGRGRNSVFMNLKPGLETDGPDVLFTNAVELKLWRTRSRANLVAYENIRNYFLSSGNGNGPDPRRLKYQVLSGDNVAFDPNWYGTAIDVDGDGQMELLTMQDLRIYKLIAPFKFRDITSQVLPSGKDFSGTVAVAEFDYDNDGRFDLYIARTNRGDLKWLPSANAPYRDYILRNVGGRYVDVTWRANLPRELVAHVKNRAKYERTGDADESRGVTTGDFNNDGWMDLLVTRWNSPDILLLNNRDGTFRSVETNFNRPSYINGDMATAVDYNRDGRLDILLSEGHTHNKERGGYYRLMKNISEKKAYLLVRVGSSNSRTATSLHAVVTVRTWDIKMVRRVGSPGTAVSNSYIELIHFGLGRRSKVVEVSVKWTDGTTESQYDISVNRVLTFGKV